tara:strand:+ start:244 stop:504 length:261 start_codon:yes stop_codon:yes gene_type:complete
MSSTYGNDHSRLAKIHAVALAKHGRVLGYAVSRRMSEVLYAVDAKGNIKRTVPIMLPNDEFGNNGVWSRTDRVPADAEFIGTYEAV